MTLLNISQATMHEGTAKEAYELLKKSAALGYSRAAYDYAHYRYHQLGDHTETVNKKTLSTSQKT